MQDTLQSLRSLQEVDQRIFRVRAELTRLPKERDARAAQLKQLEDKKATLEARAADLRTRIKEIEDDTTQQRQRMRKVESEAMKSRGDVALQAAFQHEARSLKRDVSSAEEEGLRLLDEAEQLTNEIGQLDARVTEERKVYEEFATSVAAEIADAEGRLAELEAERAKRMSTEIPPEILSTYERLLAVRDGQALAVLDGKICQACYMETPPNLYVRVARGVELVQCPNCDRFLYLPVG